MAKKSKKKILPNALEMEGDVNKTTYLDENPDSIEQKFGRKIHTLRLEKRISQDLLASRAQVTRNYISEVERGRRNVSIRTVEKLSQALGVDIQELFS